jgi:hypothetical protein
VIRISVVPLDKVGWGHKALCKHWNCTRPA